MSEFDPPPQSPTQLAELLGGIDIYLFDQLMKGRIDPAGKILDAGCGGGRNLVYFLRCGAQVWGVDQEPRSIAQVRRLAAHLHPDLPSTNFHCESLETPIFEDGFFDVVLSNAVLHFMEDLGQFTRVLEQMWRVLRPGGLFFCRLASSIGIEAFITEIAPGVYRLPDGSDRFLVNLELLLSFTQRLGGELLDPIKTTNVQNLRCMTTWVVLGPAGPGRHPGDPGWTAGRDEGTLGGQGSAGVVHLRKGRAFGHAPHRG